MVVTAIQVQVVVILPATILCLVKGSTVNLVRSEEKEALKLEHAEGNTVALAQGLLHAEVNIVVAVSNPQHAQEKIANPALTGMLTILLVEANTVSQVQTLVIILRMAVLCLVEGNSVSLHKQKTHLRALVV